MRRQPGDDGLAFIDASQHVELRGEQIARPLRAVLGADLKEAQEFDEIGPWVGHADL